MEAYHSGVWDMTAKACPVAGTLWLAYGKAHIMHSAYHVPRCSRSLLALARYLQLSA